jgi:hypothetical protein
MITHSNELRLFVVIGTLALLVIAFSSPVGADLVPVRDPSLAAKGSADHNESSEATLVPKARRGGGAHRVSSPPRMAAPRVAPRRVAASRPAATRVAAPGSTPPAPAVTAQKPPVAGVVRRSPSGETAGTVAGHKPTDGAIRTPTGFTRVGTTSTTSGQTLGAGVTSPKPTSVHTTGKPVRGVVAGTPSKLTTTGRPVISAHTSGRPQVTSTSPTKPGTQKPPAPVKGNVAGTKTSKPPATGKPVPGGQKPVKEQLASATPVTKPGEPVKRNLAQTTRTPQGDIGKQNTFTSIQQAYGEKYPLKPGEKIGAQTVMAAALEHIQKDHKYTPTTDQYRAACSDIAAIRDKNKCSWNEALTQWKNTAGHTALTGTSTVKPPVAPPIKPPITGLTSGTGSHPPAAPTVTPTPIKPPTISTADSGWQPGQPTTHQTGFWRGLPRDRNQPYFYEQLGYPLGAQFVQSIIDQGGDMRRWAEEEQRRRDQEPTDAGFGAQMIQQQLQQMRDRSRSDFVQETLQGVVESQSASPTPTTTANPTPTPTPTATSTAAPTTVAPSRVRTDITVCHDASYDRAYDFYDRRGQSHQLDTSHVTENVPLTDESLIKVFGPVAEQQTVPIKDLRNNSIVPPHGTILINANHSGVVEGNGTVTHFLPVPRGDPNRGQSGNTTFTSLQDAQVKHPTGTTDRKNPSTLPGVHAGETVQQFLDARAAESTAGTTQVLMLVPRAQR